MEVISSNTPIARKDHTCDYCIGDIKKGETYSNVAIKGDYLYTWKSHLDCQKLVDVLDMEGAEGVTSDDFVEYVNDAFSYAFPDHGKATFGERLQMVKEYFLAEKELIK